MEFRDEAQVSYLTTLAGTGTTSAEVLLTVFLLIVLFVMAAVVSVLDLAASVTATAFFPVRLAAVAFSSDMTLAPVCRWMS